MSGHTLVIEVNAGGLVAAEHLGKGVAEFAFKIEHLPIVRAELFLQGCPRNEGGFSRVYAVKPLRQPGVNVEGHSRVCQSREVGFVEGYGVPL